MKRIVYLQEREKVSADLIKVLINVGTMDAPIKQDARQKTAMKRIKVLSIAASLRIGGEEKDVFL